MLRKSVIGNSSIPGEKSFYLKQISPRILVEMTALLRFWATQ